MKTGVTMGFYTIIEPKYYQQFSCIGGSCELNCCCSNWGNIIWTNSEYEKLCSAEMSDELRRKVNSSFFQKDYNGIKIWNIYQQDSDCPFLTEQKLCELQLTFGEDILSQTCRAYPRTSLMNNAVLTRGCYLSCPEVGKLLYNNKDAMEISTRMVQIKSSTTVCAKAENAQDFEASPSLRYRNILFDFFYELCANENYSIETGLVLGGLAAKKLSEYEITGKHNSIPEVIKTLKKQIGSHDQIASIESINPDNRIKIGVVGTLMLDMAREIKSLKVLESLTENGGINIEKYFLGEQAVKKLFEGHEFYFRNMVLNMLFELKAPLYLPQRTIYENWLLICTCYSMSLMMMNAQALSEPDINLILKAPALLDMSYGHNEKLSDQIINFLKDRSFDKSAYIALMLK